VELLKESPNFPERKPPIRVKPNTPTSWLKFILTGIFLFPNEKKSNESDEKPVRRQKRGKRKRKRK
jgi:hypothetical protein